MKINDKAKTYDIKTKVAKAKKVITKNISEGYSKIPSKVRTASVIAMFLLPTLGIVNKCTNNNADNNNIVVVDTPVDKSYIDDYTEKTDSVFYTVAKGDTPASIAKKHGVSVMRLLAANGMDENSIIYPNDNIIIPQAYTVKNITSCEDVAKLIGVGEEYIKDLENLENFRNEIYTDRNGNKTIGVGHLVKPDEIGKFGENPLSDKEVYTILAQDLLDRDLNMQTFINESVYNEMPSHFKESVLDLIFNKGEGAVKNNEELLKAINEKDYPKAISLMTQDYSVVTNAKGEKIKRYASGLNKRRLYDMQNASKMFKNGAPDVVIESAKEVYQKGLEHMKAEVERGEIPENAYPNVLAEYNSLVNKWFDGKIQTDANSSVEKSSTIDNEKKTNSTNEKKVEAQSKKSTVDEKTVLKNGNQKIFINGKNTQKTLNEIYKDWESTAKRYLRPFKRPLPVVDKNGNIVAAVKVLDAKKKGTLSGKTFIINPGHGGCMANKKADGSLNTNFDPGTSNAIMSKKNPNIETNQFIGNGGKALEEWWVNQKIADELTEAIRNNGGKVIYVQGSVYTAMDAIRDLQKKNKINAIVSLHSNSDGAKRGIYVIANNRNGLDKADDAFSKKITDKMNQHSWFNGLVHQTSQSLGVLSISDTTTSPIPGVLVETGNLKNETDVANLNSKNFRSYMVQSILDGIIDYNK